MLDIIMPHYKEPWEKGEKFFMMLDLQRGIDFSQVNVIIVNDGEENHLFVDELDNKPYKVRQIDIPHAGVSAARNAGLEAATEEWVMFCDFDDMFANVYALRDILGVLPAPNKDMLWTTFISEDPGENGVMRLWPRGQNLVFTHGKLYRRQMLLDNNLRFDTRLSFNEDSCFNAIMAIVVPYQRIGEIKTPSPSYIWCWSADSTVNRNGSTSKAILGQYMRNKIVCDAYRERMPLGSYGGMILRTAYDTYYALNADNLPEDLEVMLEDFKAWWKEHKVFAKYAKEEDVPKILDIAKREHEALERQNKDRGKVDEVLNFQNEKSFEDWLKECEE